MCIQITRQIRNIIPKMAFHKLMLHLILIRIATVYKYVMFAIMFYTEVNNLSSNIFHAFYITPLKPIFYQKAKRVI